MKKLCFYCLLLAICAFIPACDGLKGCGKESETLRANVSGEAEVNRENYSGSPKVDGQAGHVPAPGDVKVERVNEKLSEKDAYLSGFTDGALGKPGNLTNLVTLYGESYPIKAYEIGFSHGNKYRGEYWFCADVLAPEDTIDEVREAAWTNAECEVALAISAF